MILQIMLIYTIGLALIYFMLKYRNISEKESINRFRIN